MTAAHDSPPSEGSDGHQRGDIVAGKYLLQHVIGVGGMGTVWAATNLDLDLEVALKLVITAVDSEETRTRLVTEARAEAKIQHRGIVRVFDLGVTEQGEPFLVMERLEGRTLGDWITEVGHLEPTAAVRIMLPVIDALGYAHARGVVHRDLKPDNIFLAEQRGRVQPKLVDFGIAKLADMPAAGRCTGHGAVVGSPGYMAPEHARGGEVDHRADLFTAAVVLYEIITGRSAFQGENYNALLRAVIEEDIPPLTALHLGDTALSGILERGLKKDPRKRYQSAMDLGRALATWLEMRGETDDISGEPLSIWWASAAQKAPSSGAHRPVSAPARALSSGDRPTKTTSLRGMALPTTGFAPKRPGRRLAFVALALSGFVGGFAATTTFDLLPWQHGRGTAIQVAAASTAPPIATSTVVVTPVATPVSVRPIATVSRNVPERAVPPAFAKHRAHPKATPYDSAPPEPLATSETIPVAAPSSAPAMTLPPDPPPPSRLKPPELKDPYQ